MGPNVWKMILDGVIGAGKGLLKGYNAGTDRQVDSLRGGYGGSQAMPSEARAQQFANQGPRQAEAPSLDLDSSPATVIDETQFRTVPNRYPMAGQGGDFIRQMSPQQLEQWTGVPNPRTQR